MPPIFDWQCEECESVTEVTRPTKDYLIPPDDGCQKCRSTNLRKIIVRPKNCKGVLLLGETGWHDKEYTKFRSIRG